MKYEELVERVRQSVQKAIVSKAVGHIAYQFNVVGEAEGAFYLEMSEGKVSVEPYEYYDRNLIVETTADVIVQMVEGKLKPMEAYVNNQLKAYGEVGLLKVLPFGCDGKSSAKKTQVSTKFDID